MKSNFMEKILWDHWKQNCSFKVYTLNSQNSYRTFNLDSYEFRSFSKINWWINYVTDNEITDIAQKIHKTKVENKSNSRLLLIDHHTQWYREQSRTAYVSEAVSCELLHKQFWLRPLQLSLASARTASFAMRASFWNQVIFNWN